MTQVNDQTRFIRRFFSGEICSRICVSVSNKTRCQLRFDEQKLPQSERGKCEPSRDLVGAGEGHPQHLLPETQVGQKPGAKSAFRILSGHYEQVVFACDWSRNRRHNAELVIQQRFQRVFGKRIRHHVQRLAVPVEPSCCRCLKCVAITIPCCAVTP